MCRKSKLHRLAQNTWKVNLTEKMIGKQFCACTWVQGVKLGFLFKCLLYHRLCCPSHRWQDLGDADGQMSWVKEMGLWVDFKRECRWLRCRCIKFQSRPSDTCITNAMHCNCIGVLSSTITGNKTITQDNTINKQTNKQIKFRSRPSDTCITTALYVASNGIWVHGVYKTMFVGFGRPLQLSGTHFV